MACELRSVIHLHVAALEERKRDLLALVETIRLSKMNALKSQSESVSLHKTRLLQVLIHPNHFGQHDKIITDGSNG